MNPGVKVKWVAALRSGDYKQGKGVLAYRSPEGDSEFCCLGVLCEIAVKEGVIPPPVVSDNSSLYGEGADRNSQLLPASVAAWAQANNLVWNGGNFEVQVPEELRLPGYAWESRDVLSALNDYGATFAQIADLIEEQL